MPIIYSYPIINTVNNADMFVISKSPADPAVDEWETKSLTADNLASYVTARVNLNFLGDTGTGVVNLDTQNLTISGTSNEIETSASSQTLQIGLPDSVTITDNLTVGQGVSGNITVGDSGSQSQIAGYLDLTEVFVNDTLEVDGDTTLNNDLDVGGNAEIGGSLNMTLSRINNVSNPTLAQDAATKSYVDTLVSGGLTFRGSFRADTGEILSGANTGSYLYNCPGGAGTRVAILTGDYYIVANTGGNFYCSGDLLNVGDSIIAVADAAADSSTINDWSTVESDNVEGTGIANTVPVWTDSQVLGNSLITSVVGGIFPGSKELTFDTTPGIQAQFLGGAKLESGNFTINVGGSPMIGLNQAFDGNSSYGFMVLQKVASHTVTQISAQDTPGRDITYFNSPAAGQETTNSALRIDNGTRKVYLPETYTASGATTDRNLIIGASGEIKIGAASNTTSGSGTTQTLPLWSDGPAGVLSDSVISQVLDGGGAVREVNIVTTSGLGSKLLFNGAGNKLTMENSSGDEVFFFPGDNTGFYANNLQMRGTLAVGRSQQATAATLDVGAPTDTRPAAWFRNGVVISNNPSGVQVDNTSMVIGAGNNDNVSGSDHCLIVGSGNQITSNSDQSVAFGQGNTITDSTDSLAVGNNNTVSSAQRVYALGYNNTIDSASSFVAGGDNNVVGDNTNIVLGYSHSTTLSQNFVIGNDLTSDGNKMVLGYRNQTTYPTPNENLGLGITKFVVATGSSTTNNSNALLITEGGRQSGGIDQIPRIIFPTVVGFNFADDTAAAAGGIPVGGLYHNAGALRIRLT